MNFVLWSNLTVSGEQIIDFPTYLRLQSAGGGLRLIGEGEFLSMCRQTWSDLVCSQSSAERGATLVITCSGSRKPKGGPLSGASNELCNSK